MFITNDTDRMHDSNNYRYQRINSIITKWCRLKKNDNKLYKMVGVIMNIKE